MTASWTVAKLTGCCQCGHPATYVAGYADPDTNGPVSSSFTVTNACPSTCTNHGAFVGMDGYGINGDHGYLPEAASEHFTAIKVTDSRGQHGDRRLAPAAGLTSTPGIAPFIVRRLSITTSSRIQWVDALPK